MNWEERKKRLLILIVLMYKRINKIMLYLGIIFNLVLLYMMIFVEFNITFVIFVVNLYNVIMLYMKDYKERRMNEKVIP